MKVKLPEVSNITTGKLDSNASVDNGEYRFYTCAPNPLRTNTFAFECDAILLAGNNSQGNFHIHRFNGKFNAYQRTYVITAKEGWDIDYIGYSIEMSLNNLKRMAQGSQTKFLTMDILSRFALDKKPYEEQLKQVDILKNIDKKINLNREIINVLESYLKLQFNYWFLQFDFPDKKGRPYKSSGGKMVWNDKLEREIPEGWEVKKLADLVNFTKIKKKPDSNKKLIDLSVMNSGTLVQDECNNGDFSKTNLFELNKGDILWGSIRPYLNKYAIAPFDGLVAGTIHRMRVNRDFYHSFVVGLVMSEYFLKFSISRSEGTKMPVIKEEELKNIYIPYNEDLYKKFYNILPLDKLIPNLIEENQELKNQRDFLLPLLMNGQVKIK